MYISKPTRRKLIERNYRSPYRLKFSRIDAVLLFFERECTENWFDKYAWLGNYKYRMILVHGLYIQRCSLS